MQNSKQYKDFLKRLTVLIKKHPDLMITTLSNIFTMRLIGNKTHGDLAEIAISEFINQYMYDFRSKHVGKDLYRSKSHEEDIKVINEITKEEFSVSLKAYGQGPLQLSTDKDSLMFSLLHKQKSKNIKSKKMIRSVFSSKAFSSFQNINLLPLIYDERNKKCNILIFDYKKAQKNASQIIFENKSGRRKYPVFRFYDAYQNYICEVRYGGKNANALQRGLWTDTKKGIKYFDSVTGDWITYSHNLLLVTLFSQSLVSSKEGHQLALKKIKENIMKLKRTSRLKK